MAFADAGWEYPKGSGPPPSGEHFTRDHDYSSLGASWLGAQHKIDSILAITRNKMSLGVTHPHDTSTIADIVSDDGGALESCELETTKQLAVSEGNPHIATVGRFLSTQP